MPEQIEDITQGGGSSSLKPMAAAAAATVAAAAAGMIAKKALSGHGSSNGSNNGSSTKSEGGSSGNTMFGAIASGGWDAARDALLPAAEDAAGAVGSFVAQNAPEIVRERIVPRFIESFNEARDG